jgi:hypothetical protein
VPSPFDAVGDASTLGGVALGALVATLGSFAASLYEHRHFRREREADAALVFGELLHALSLHIQVLRDAHSRGDPFGPITIRMARAVRREIEIYDRNRERLFGVRDATLRLHTHALMARLTFALERVLDTTETLAASPSPTERSELAMGREQAFEFLVECADELPKLASRFAALAKAKLADLDPSAAGLTPPASLREPRGRGEA